MLEPTDEIAEFEFEFKNAKNETILRKAWMPYMLIEQTFMDDVDEAKRFARQRIEASARGCLH